MRRTNCASAGTCRSCSQGSRLGRLRCVPMMVSEPPPDCAQTKAGSIGGDAPRARRPRAEGATAAPASTPTRRSRPGRDRRRARLASRGRLSGPNSDSTTTSAGAVARYRSSRGVSPWLCQVLSASTVRLCSDRCPATWSVRPGSAPIAPPAVLRSSARAPASRAGRPSASCPRSAAWSLRRGRSRARLAASPRPMRWPVSGAMTSASAVKPLETTTNSAEGGNGQHQQRQPPARWRSPRSPATRHPTPPSRLLNLAVYPTETIGTTGNKQEPCRQQASCGQCSNCARPSR